MLLISIALLCLSSAFADRHQGHPHQVMNGSLVLPLFQMSNSTLSTILTSPCRILAQDSSIAHHISELLKRQLKLIEYHFKVEGYDNDPLTADSVVNYKSDLWSRVASSHGQTILNLAFNYGILSLQTLSFGVIKMEVMLEVSLILSYF